MWASKISSSQEGSPIDVTIGFSQMTLDVIGLAGMCLLPLIYLWVTVDDILCRIQL